MNIKAIILLLFFSFNSFSSFAVIDMKKTRNAKVASTLDLDINKKKRWFQKKERRKFKLFKWLKKNKSNKDISIRAILSITIAVVGLILLIIDSSWVLFIMYFLAEVIALILGIVALKEIKQNFKKRGKGLAWLGIIIGGINVALFLLFIILFLNGNFD